MKQIITLCLLVTIIFNVDAQVKKVVTKPIASTLAVPAPKIPQETAKVSSGPTKEETVTFIKDYFVNQKVGWTPKGGRLSFIRTQL